LNKSLIEWTEFTSNPVKGKCPVDCSFCYVKPLRKRYKWHEDIRFYPEELESIRRRKKPSRIFMGSTIELFHKDTIQYMPEILETVKACLQHTFMFLTKQPQNMAKFSPFPDNCYCGVTATNGFTLARAETHLQEIKAKVKFISFEPLLSSPGPGFDWMYLHDAGIKWVIIGSQTKPTIMPKIEWVKEIVEAADKANVSVFLKDSLYKLLMERPTEDHDLYWAEMSVLRQEMPVLGKG